MAQPIRLTLYVSGRNYWAEQNLERLRDCLQSEIRSPIQSEIIDVLDSPHRAESAKIIATPTLVKEDPPPSRKVIGDLSDLERVISFLGLRNQEELTTTGNHE